jgi:two-component system cell cycle response regulator
VSLVLVVDDHLDTCQLLVRLLKRIGYPAACVESGQAALDFVRETVPALVFLDVMMPEMDGFAVLERLRADPALIALPVVMYSAMDDPAAARRAMALGANEYVVKGQMRYADLRQLVERYIGLPGGDALPALTTIA